MSLTWPLPGLWLGKWGKQRGKRSSGSWNRREPQPSCPGLKRLQDTAESAVVFFFFLTFLHFSPSPWFLIPDF